MELGDLVHGREAAEILGVARADDVWRAVRRHGDACPGALTVLQFGRMKAVGREELRGFAAWYNRHVRHPVAVRDMNRPPARLGEARAAERSVGDRRRALRAAIERITNQ